MLMNTLKRKKMKAVVKYGQENGMVELREVDIPKIGPNDVLLEVKAAGICGSDIEMWRHHFTYKVNTPVIQGHEFCGVIVEVGEGVKGYHEGDKVISETSAYVCGKCRFCRSGFYNMCPDRLGYGYGTDGAFTNYVKVRQEILHRMPDSLSFEEAALTEPVCVAYNAVIARSRVMPGDTVVIIGPGPIGLCCLQIARIAGASRIIVSGTAADHKRLESAAEMGADITINSEQDDAVAQVLALTDGVGADLVVDCAGSSITLKQSLEMVRRLGQITKIGWGPKPVNMSLDLLLSKSATLQGTYGHHWSIWKQVITLLEKGMVRTGSLVSTVLPVSDWENAFNLVEKKKVVKVILTPIPINN
jgi:alcohol dehydrogenase/L-iditol 2-dehydrogenase